MKASYLYVFGIGLALIAAAATAQQYKWKDARGRWQYGDIPPAGVTAVPLKPPPRPVAPAKPAGSESGAKAAGSAAAKDSKPLTAAEKEMEFRRRIKEAQETAAKKAKEEKAERDRKENCDLAREQVRTLASGQRISRVDTKGERYYVNDAQRAQELAKSRSRESQWCK